MKCIKLQFFILKTEHHEKAYFLYKYSDLPYFL